MILDALFNEKTTYWLKNKEPFFFLVDFSGNNVWALTFEEARTEEIYFSIAGNTNYLSDVKNSQAIPSHLDIEPIGFNKYQKAFDRMMHAFHYGDSFLANLTLPTEIVSPLDLKSLFYGAQAPYKLYFKNKFVCFSPEPFIQIIKNRIQSFPMKGTIDAKEENAKERLLNNPKEMQEHATIVDLIRNDLAMVASQVKVKKYRYISQIKTGQTNLLQTSSTIEGLLPEDWRNHFGEILGKLLPAGSITGAPKARTIALLKKAENYNRGYYTGVFGLFDGYQIKSAVAIRFIERSEEGRLWYKSGGGLTHLSNAAQEYQELQQKIYVPTL